MSLFYSLSHLHHVTASLPSPCDNHQSTGGRSERIQCLAKMAAWNSFSYICTRALYSFRSFTHWWAASNVIPLLPKATFTPSIQPNLGLPCTHPPLTSAINTLLACGHSCGHPSGLWAFLCSAYFVATVKTKQIRQRANYSSQRTNHRSFDSTFLSILYFATFVNSHIHQWLPPVSCRCQNVDLTLEMKKYLQFFIEQAIGSYFKKN